MQQETDFWQRQMYQRNDICARQKMRSYNPHDKYDYTISFCWEMVPVKGLEPPLSLLKQILSLPRLPFRHTGPYFIVQGRVKPPSDKPQKHANDFTLYLHTANRGKWLDIGTFPSKVYYDNRQILSPSRLPIPSHRLGYKRYFTIEKQRLQCSKLMGQTFPKSKTRNIAVFKRLLLKVAKKQQILCCASGMVGFNLVMDALICRKH